MGKLRENLPLRAAGWAAFLASACAALFLGQQALFALSLTWSGDWTTTGAFRDRLSEGTEQVRDYVQYLIRQNGEGLDFVDRERYETLYSATREALAPENTNLRYQILSEDGSEVLDSNLAQGEDSLEELVGGVYYGVLEIRGDNSVEFTEKGGLSAYSGAVTDSSAAENSEAMVLIIQESAVLRYGVLQPEHMTARDGFYEIFSLYSDYVDHLLLYGGLALGLGGAAAVLLLLLLWASGRRPGVEGVVLSWPDRVFSELWLAALLAVAVLLYQFFFGVYEPEAVWAVDGADRGLLLAVSAAGTAAAGAGVALGAAFLRTLTVRVKARALARTTLLCRVVMFLWRSVSDFVRSLPLTWRAALTFLTYLAAVLAADSLWPFRLWYPLPGVVLNLAALMVLCWWSAGFWRVRKGAEVIAAGNLDHQIDTAHLPGDLKRQAEALNNISGGLTNAVNEQMKSERFKAELITNVSHDLKTPLTSIINYVNLLKNTQQTDPAALEYIEVLDRKSQRLKKLTEDLVEASKASTGALTVDREKIGLVQLLDQALGEYEERLEGKQLALVRTLPEGECFVYADGRHLWRVMDNLLSNCAKYALEGTRVYIEIARGRGSVSLSVKNISREPLNVPPERLMERFVRGEESRTTEGSGLGLSIAKSLTELQGGTFELMVDGDLFKAVVTLPQAS